MVSGSKKTDSDPHAAFLSHLAKVAISSSVIFLFRVLDEGGARRCWVGAFCWGCIMLGLVYGVVGVMAFWGVGIGAGEDFRDWVSVFGITVSIMGFKRTFTGVRQKRLHNAGAVDSKCALGSLGFEYRWIELFMPISRIAWDASYHFHSCQVAHMKWAWPGPATFDAIKSTLFRPLG